MLIKRLMMMGLMFLLACSGAMAIQTLNSASGYVLLPDASVVAAKEVQVSTAYVASEGTSELSKVSIIAVCHGRGFNLRAIAGISDKTEAGIGWQNVHKSIGDANSLTVAAKTKLLDRPESGLAISGGLLFRPWNSNMTMDGLNVDLPKVTSLYLVLDKTCTGKCASGWTWGGSIGLMYDSFSSSQQSSIFPFVVSPDLPVDADGTIAAQSFIEPFVGVRAVKAGWTLLGEYKPQLKKGDFLYQSATWSLAARKEIKPGLTGTAGLTNFNIPYTDADTGWFIDISYALPK